MTTAPVRTVSAAPSRRPAAPPAVITALVVARGVDSLLTETLAAVRSQSTAVAHVVVLDTSSDGSVRASLEEAADPPATVLALPGLPSRVAISRAVLEGSVPPGTTHLWFLTSHSAPAPGALRAVSSAVRSSPSTGLAGPKQVDWEDPTRLCAFGIQATRTGRLLLAPGPGERDQGQYNHRTDTLAVPVEGMFIERSVFETLQGFEVLHGDLGSDLDLGWRAHQAGHRAVLAPGAVVRVQALDHGTPTPAQRREVRQVALTRCAWWTAPLLAAWVIASGLLAALGLLLLKRPRAAWSELTDIAGALTPWQALGARWRSRGTRRVARRDLGGLFVTRQAVARSALDALNDAIAPDGDVDERVRRAPDEDAALEPTARPGHALRHPGALAVAATVVMTVTAARSIPGGLLQRVESGLVGGELLGGRAGSTTLWHAWWDGWHGAGFGTDSPASPSVGVLALVTWVVEHVPWIGPVASPAGAALAWLVLLALPVACGTAYTSGRVITSTRWARALAALAWASTAVAATAVADGRIGALVALILLPPAAAGLIRLARPTGTMTTAFATALVAAVLGAFVPLLLGLVLMAGLGVVAGGRHGARARGLVVVLVPPLLLGPWLVELVRTPAQILAGAGTVAWTPQVAAPWQLALAHPGGPGSYAVLASLPLVLLGAVGLVRGSFRDALANAVAVTAVVGLLVALAAPHVVLGSVPAGQAGAGDPVTMWSGLGLLPYVLALLAGALLGVDRIRLRGAGRWALIARWPLVAVAGVAVLGGAGLVAWGTFGTVLTPWSDPRPAVAVDQADGPVANRALLVEPTSGAVDYRVVGREVDGMVRGLPAVPTADEAVSGALGGLLAGDGSDGPDPVAVLVSRAVGFVQVSQDAPASIAHTLDVTGGLARLGPHEGMNVWRVEPPRGGVDTTAVAPSRLSIMTATDRTQFVPTTGENAATSTTVDVPRDSVLTVAEPPQWAQHATVTVDGAVVVADTSSGLPEYSLPAGSADLSVDVLPTRQLWQRAQIVLILLVGFLAIPFGSRASRMGS